MRITYAWTERDWREATAMARRRGNRRPVMPGFTWAVILVPLAGGSGDLISQMRGHGAVTLAGSIVPVLLILFTAVAALVLAVTHVQRRRRDQASAHMPTGECEALLQETGWRFQEKAADGQRISTDDLQPWNHLLEARRSERVIVLHSRDGFHAIPTCSLTPEQGGHLHRLILRKVRPPVAP